MVSGKDVTCCEDLDFQEDCLEHMTWRQVLGTRITEVSQMGLGRVWEWGCVPDKLTKPAKPSVANLALSRRSVNICYIEMDGKPTCVLFCIIWVLLCLICLFRMFLIC